MKIKTYSIMALIVLGMTVSAIAADEGKMLKGKGHMMADEGMTKGSAIKGEGVHKRMDGDQVNNTVCPISGQKVDIMGEPVQYEHNGKLYNFCCHSCIEEFKKNPEKYIKMIKEQNAADKAKPMMDK